MFWDREFCYGDLYVLDTKKASPTLSPDVTTKTSVHIAKCSLWDKTAPGLEPLF